MPKRIVPLVNDHYYHIYNRVEQRRKLFYSNQNYIDYLTLFKKVDFSSCCRLVAYCLMPNHYHYLVYITDFELFPKKMMFFFNKYLKSLNAARSENGRYFVNRFQAKVIEDERYLNELLRRKQRGIKNKNIERPKGRGMKPLPASGGIQLCCYIHLNPIKAGFVHSPGDWPFSNYLEFIGKRRGELFDKTFFEKFIGSHSEYRKYIQSQYDDSELQPFVFEDD